MSTGSPSVDAWQTADDISSGRVSAGDVVAQALDRIHETQPVLNAFTAVFDEPQRAITPGQASVFYLGDEVIGGGWIVKSV